MLHFRQYRHYNIIKSCKIIKLHSKLKVEHPTDLTMPV